MIVRLIFWVEARLHGQAFLKQALRKAFPDHWAFMLGEIALYCFIVLLASGTFLGFLFNPSGAKTIYGGPYAPLHGQQVSAAYDSILRISLEDRAGLFVRQVHHWAALVFVAAIVVHMARVFFTGAFRKPRELNWIIGVTLLLLALAAGFTGYSLPDDLLSGTGLKITEGLILSIPFAGEWLAQAFFAGSFPNAAIAGRLFFEHVYLLPFALLGAMGAHLAIVWQQKHTQFPGPGRSEHNVVGSPLWPNYALKSIGLLCGVGALLSLLGGFMQINPVWLYGPYEPWQVASPAQPDWFVGWLEGALRLGPPWSGQAFGHHIGTPFWPAVALPGGAFALLYLWPFLEARLTGDRAEHHLLDLPHAVAWRTAAGVAMLAFLTVLLLAGSDDVQAGAFHVPVELLVLAYRGAVFVCPIAAGWVAYRVCRELQAREREAARTPPRVMLIRNAGGGYEEETRI